MILYFDLLANFIIEVIHHMNKTDLYIDKINESCTIYSDFLNELSFISNYINYISNSIQSQYQYVHIISINYNNIIIEINNTYYDIRIDKNNNSNIIVSKFIDIN